MTICIRTPGVVLLCMRVYLVEATENVVVVSCAGVVPVQAVHLVQLLLSPRCFESVPKGQAAVELVGAGPGGALLLDERLTCGQVLDALHHLAAVVSDQRRTAQVVAVVVVRPLRPRHRLERHHAHRLAGGRCAVALGRRGSTGMGAAHEQECGYKDFVHYISLYYCSQMVLIDWLTIRKYKLVRKNQPLSPSPLNQSYIY